MDEARAMALVDRISNDPQIREQFAKDPVRLFESSGITLDAEDRQTLLAAKGLEGEELTQRISKVW